MLWIHPRKPWLKLRRKVVAVIAVIQMGIRDHAQIASLVGLKPEEVARIDSAEDPCVRELSLEGLPPGEFFALVREFRCGECGARLTLVPCVTCQTHQLRHLAVDEPAPSDEEDLQQPCKVAPSPATETQQEIQLPPTEVQ